MGQPIPAMAPLHDKPPRPIVPGETWESVASQKNSGKRPTVYVYGQDERGRVNFQRGARVKWSTERVFRRDWR